ncbi:hypothetical protein ACGFYE_15615 [Streptomyces zaomyceticus]|uniref:hypothetical protein n=1 Tax=Streptomyces zaomyceticus TaxID=68286 RepID=UPI0037150B41
MDSVSARVEDLIGITTAVSAQIKHCLSHLMSGEPTKAALKAYSNALAPLGEALAELGRMHGEISHYNFTTHPAHRGSPSGLELPRQEVNETVSGCCEAADEILDAVAIELRAAAVKLMPSPSRLQPGTPGRVLRAGSALPSPPPVLPAVTPRVTKSR